MMTAMLTVENILAGASPSTMSGGSTRTPNTARPAISGADGGAARASGWCRARSPEAPQGRSPSNTGPASWPDLAASLMRPITLPDRPITEWRRREDIHAIRCCCRYPSHPHDGDGPPDDARRTRARTGRRAGRHEVEGRRPREAPGLPEHGHGRRLPRSRRPASAPTRSGASSTKVKLPTGFKIDLYAIVPDARHMAVGPASRRDVRRHAQDQASTP